MKLIRWLTQLFNHPGVFVAAALAYALGIATMLPFGYDLLPNAATAIAAGVTSLFAVGGAMAVWHYQQNQEAIAVGHYFSEVLTTARWSIRSVMNMAPGTESLTSWEGFELMLLEAIGDAGRASQFYSHSADNNVLKLRPEAVSMLAVYYPAVIKRLNGELNRARQQYAQINHKKQPAKFEKDDEFVFACREYLQFVDELTPMLK